MPRSPGGKVLSTKIRCSGGTGAIINPERVSSPIVPFYSNHKKTVAAAGAGLESRSFTIGFERRVPNRIFNGKAVTG